MLRLLAIPILLLALLAGAYAWSGGGTEKPANFTFINRGEVATLDPNRMSWMQDIRIGYALWEGLMAADPVTLNPVPGAAESFDTNSAKTVYTFHLRQNGKWSNGDKVTAADFIFAWKRMLQEPGDYTYLFFYIKGAKQYSDDFVAKKPADFSTVGIESPDPMTLRVTLNHPVTFFLDLCAFPSFFPLNESSMGKFAMVDSTTGRISFDKKFTRPENLVCNGPYKMTSWTFHKSIRLEAAETYWDRAHVKSNVIECISAENPLASFLKYDSGTADWQSDVTGDIAAQLYATHRPDLHVFTGFGTYFYSFNCNPNLPSGKPNPFHDVRVRQALCMSIDKKQIVDTITRMGETPATNYIPPGIFADYHSPQGLPFDIQRAKKLLADAGFPDGANFPKVNLLFNSEAQHGDIAQNVCRQWSSNLNINLNMEPLDIKTFRERLHTKNYDIARASWFGDYNDVSTFTDKYLSASDNNDSNWINLDYDALLAKAELEADPAARLKLLEEAEAMIDNEVPILPVFYYVGAYLFRDNVKGIPLNPRNMVNFKSVEVVRAK